MLKLGENQTLTVARRTEHGIYLTDREDGEEVLLPRHYLTGREQEGDSLEVFLYLDSEDRPVATTDQPKLRLHEVGRLKVCATGKLGAFLDWGLPKDLFLPYANQTTPVRKGQEILCAPILDKSGRLAATMNVYEWLETGSHFRAGDWTEGTAYEKSGNFGIFVAVEDRYSALLPRKELTRDVAVGEKLRVRVTRVLPDGRLDLSLRETAVRQMDEDAEKLLSYLSKNGTIPFTDKAEPSLIRNTFAMSKNEFKRAVGHLLKEGRIAIGTDRIEKKD